jgi:glutamyl-tRNA reductase
MNIAYKGNVEIIGTSRLHGVKTAEASEISEKSSVKLSNLLVDPNVKLIDYSKRYEYISDVDVVISATTSPHYTITRNDLIARKDIKTPKVFIDLAVPPDIDRSLADIEGVELYDIDYFNTLARNNNQLKQTKAQIAEKSAEEWARNIEKELKIHDLIEQIPVIEKAVNEKGIGKLIYSLRKMADKEQVDGISKWLTDYVGSVN